MTFAFWETEFWPLLAQARKFFTAEKFAFIPNGVNTDAPARNYKREEISKILGVDIKDKKIIFRLGRFVPHKGTSWFIRNVMPKLPENVIMIAAGSRVGKNTAGDKDDFLYLKK